jgi:CRISPR-associated protein Cas6
VTTGHSGNKLAVQSGEVLMPMVELHFPVLGTSLPTDHGYALYAAVSRALPSLHTHKVALLLGPILGMYTGNGLLHLDGRRSRLRMRLPAEVIGTVLALAGKVLDVGGHRLRVGVPQVRALVPAPALVARLVVIKGFTEAEPFQEAAQRKLHEMGIAKQAKVPTVRRKDKYEGKARRHVLRIKGRRVVGFTVQVAGLTPEESMKLQENGLGGKGRMGCGFFVPMRAE